MSTVAKNLPALEVLKTHPQWVCFNKGKMPFTPISGKAAKASIPDTWGTFQEAAKAQKSNPAWYKGVGYETVKEQGITIGDIDKCIDENGIISTYAQHVIQVVNSYFERSPSGRGLRFIAYGTIPSNLGADIDCDGDERLEMKDHGGFYTITGNHLEGTPTTIEDRQEQLTALYEEKRETRRKTKEQKYKQQPSPTKNTPSFGSTPYGLKALADEAGELANCGEGGRNQRLNNAAYTLGRLVAGNELTQSEVERALQDACQCNGLVTDDGERSVQATIRSGISKGLLSPRSAPVKPEYIPYIPTPIASNGNGNHNNNGKKAAISQDDTQFILECLGQDEWGDALLFAHLNRGKALYDFSEGQWYLFNHHHWKLDEQGKVKHLVSGQLASTYLQAAASVNLQAGAAISDEDEAKQDGLKKTIKALTTRALLLRKVARNANVLTFASSQEGMGITSGRWDTNPWLLPVKNGVVDLRTGQLRDGQPQDYIRTFSPTTWEGLNAPALQWGRTLHEIFEDREPSERQALIDFLQRALGYGITGLVNEHVFLVLYGEDGRNGKDTLISVIAYVLGSMAGALSNDVFLSAGKFHTAGSATPHLCALQGKRLAWGSEPESGAKFNAGQVKEITGGGAIPARQNYGKQYTFDPTFLLLLLTNHKPHADATDNAFWARLRLITFNMRYVDNPDPNKPYERKPDITRLDSLKAEASGVLAWLVRGCLAWQAQGLNAPASVLTAGKEYQREEDNIASFLDECCVVKPGLVVRAGHLYKRYDEWCKDGNTHAMNGKNFGARMSKQFKKEKDREGWFYEGVGLLCDGTVTGHNSPVTPLEKPLEAVSCDGCDGNSQEVSLREDNSMGNNKFTSIAVTPVTNPINKSGLEQDGKPIDGTVTGHNSPVTPQKGLGRRCTDCKRAEAVVWWKGDVPRCRACQDKANEKAK